MSLKIFKGVVYCAALCCLALSAVAQNSESLTSSTVGQGAGSLRDCTAFPDYQQPLDTVNFNTARTSDVQIALEIREDVVNGAGMITTLPAGSVSGLRWWGVSIEFNPAIGFVGQCLADDNAGTSFNFFFYADAAGVPGALLGTRTAAPSSIVDTGFGNFLGATIKEYDASFAPIDTTNVSWIAIQRQTGQQAASGNDCYFLWVDETLGTTYDNQAHSLTGGIQPTDQTMCIALGAGEADLEITKSGSVVGNQIVYAIQVTNNGPDDATNVVVTDPLPAEVTYVSDDCGGMDVPPWTWNVGMLANGSSVTCNVTTSINPGVDPATTIVNVASVSADQADNVPGNDSATGSVVIDPLAIPTLGQVGLLALLLLLGAAAVIKLRSR